MKDSLTILWPEFAAPNIEEIRFSYAFCRNLSRQHCGGSERGRWWLDCTPDLTLARILPRIRGDMVLLVSQPEIVLSPLAIEILTSCLKKGYRLCGPVYNQTSFPLQTANLSFPYVDMETYIEVADILASSNGHTAVPADSLDPGCLLCGMDQLQKIPEQTIFSELPPWVLKMSADAMAVASGALVHSGFVKGFETDRLDLVRLVPEGVKRILDIGCAMGGYGKALKQERPGIYLTGVELNAVMAESALPYYDEVINCHIEEAGIRGVFDLINCGDILEHLQDPWKILNDLNGLLKDGGYLVLSIPNAGHWSIVKALLRGNFQYVPLGLLCIGHLRWFTESSIRSALEQTGFSVEVFQRHQMPATPQGEVFIRDMCTAGFGRETSLRTHEFIIRAIKRSR